VEHDDRARIRLSADRVAVKYPPGAPKRLRTRLRTRQTEEVDVVAYVVLVVLLAVPLVIVGVMFVWAAQRDGEDDRAIQRRLGMRRKTRLGR
jgi:hypothetical protein